MAKARAEVMIYDAAKSADKYPREVRDEDVVAVQRIMQRSGFAGISKEVIRDAIHEVAKMNAFHPVKDYLNDLVWDGVRRIHNWLHRYFGAGTSNGGWKPGDAGSALADPYHAAVGRIWLVSQVARIMEPGCKADMVVIIQGLQGSLKSSAIRIMGDEWFSDSMPDIRTKDALLHLRGKWIIELAELSALRKSDLEFIKAFVSRREDIYRDPYAHKERTFPRQCIFIGTTNDRHPLKDPTGNRRFAPFWATEIDLAGLRADRDQLMAEAYQLYKSATPWWPVGEEEELFKAEQEDRFNEDAWTDPIVEFVGEVRQGMSEGNTYWETGFTVMEVARRLGFCEWKEVNGQVHGRIVSVLEHIGCTRRTGATGKPIVGSKGKTWLPPSEEPVGNGPGDRERAEKAADAEGLVNYQGMGFEDV
jgi:predicted P-loop ATPase